MLRHELANGYALRLLEEADADELHATVLANRAHLERWMPWVHLHDAGPPAALDFIRDSRRRLAANDGLQTAVVAPDGALAGVAGFHAVNWGHRTTSIGYWLAEAHTGRGTMTLAVRALLDLAFGPWALHRVEIRAAPDNVRSRAIAERLGFRREGLLREVELVGDRRLDHVVYGRLVTDKPPAG